eukprot:TRINITY_DN47514_c0_g1_i1.p1 TRINITY_DN47514_c0_g1~~TRINITY_DN47514_c0_g1_i1.p1  ORF type:complete len:267 (+),score=51.39 TRINITY_DN47514_c0_g1_i1:36-836(+)
MATPAKLASPGYRKVGKVLFVSLRRCDIKKWEGETKLAAFQLGLTNFEKIICIPDLPENRDMCLKLLPWITVESKTTDEMRKLLKVPDGVKWQDLRDNIPEPEVNYRAIALMAWTKRTNFQREIMWLREEMRERLKIDYVKPMDALDPAEPSNTLFRFDNTSKEYWKMYIKDKMRADRRFARFTPTPAKGFNCPTPREAMGLFFPKFGRGDLGMTLHTRGRPMLGTPGSNSERRRIRKYTPLIKQSNPQTDKFVPTAGMSTTYSHY